MDIGSILLILSVFVLVIFFVVRPLTDDKATSVSADELAHSSLLAERDRILDALQELDFDFKLGKIPEDDYPVRRNMLLNKGKAVLIELDALDVHMPRPPARSDQVEEAINSRRQIKAGSQPLMADDDLETMIAARRRERQGQFAGFCPQCGQAIQQADKFCSKCGTTL